MAGTRYQSSRPCGIKEWQALPCPDLGTRYYIQFSLEDPQVQQVTKQLVPDSVRTVPLLGWARLP